MPYQFASSRQDYSDYSSGKVFYNLPGRPAFPIRLASEIFQRGTEIRHRSGLDAPVRIYDPLCGGAYHLATLVFFHWDRIEEIIASDIDADAVSIAVRNLSLLTPTGMEKRIAELSELQTRYRKESHREALASAAALIRRLEENARKHSIPTRVFQADALDPQAVAIGLGDQAPNLVITDIPYGLKSSWQVAGPLEGQSPVSRMLAALTPRLAERAVVAVASTKGVPIAHPDYKPVGKLKLGLRQVTFLQIRETSG